MNSIVAMERMGDPDTFWKRQFADEASTPQQVFDIVFGILMPLLCFYFDPGILSAAGGVFGAPLGEMSIIIYFFSGLEMIVLLLWLTSRGFRISLSPYFGGVLLAGAICSLSIGVFILPFTLLGLLFIIGALGFVPFITGFVYLRNGLRAVRKPLIQTGRASRFSVVALTSIVVLGVPTLVQWKAINIVDRSIMEIRDSETGSIDGAFDRIIKLRWCMDPDRIIKVYEQESDPEKRARLDDAYTRLTGRSIEAARYRD